MKLSKYHINPETGNPGICTAKKKCRFGADLDNEHFDSKEEAREAYEIKMRDGAFPKKYLDSMSVIPRPHRNIYKDSDAIYNTTGVVNPDFIKALKDFHYLNELKRMNNSDGERRGAARIQCERALKKVLSFDEAKANLEDLNRDSYLGTSTFDLENVGELEERPDFNIESTSVDKDEKLQDVSVLRELDYSKDNLKEYLNNAENLFNRLTPEEHNALSYWTGCGSSISATITHGVSNPWGMQCVDPDDEEYFDGKKYASTVNSALEKSDLTSNKILYRGISVDRIEDIPGLERETYGDSREKTLEYLHKEFPVGSEMSFKNPQSTSENPSRGMGFASSNIVYEISAKKAAAVGLVSAWGCSEAEYIIPSTTKYRVKGILEKVQYATRSGAPRSAIVVQLEQL